MKYLIKIVFMLLISNITEAQLVLSSSSSNEAKCGSVISEEHTVYMNQTRELRESIDLTTYRRVGDIPIAVHVIIGGSDEIPNARDFDATEVETTIEDANIILDQVGIQLLHCMPINYISEYDNSSGTMNIQTYGDIYPTVKFGSNEELAVAQAESVANVINIFIVYNLVDPSFFPLCGWASFPGEKALGKDWVFLSGNPSCSNYGSVLAHEIGHYFNLYHTHSGAREGRITELESRTNGNCGLPGVGDELCDTPADPYYNIVPDRKISDCSNDPADPLDAGADCELKTSVSCQIYDNTVTPPVLYMPDPTNVMSYGHGDCITYFSPGQIERFLISLVVDRPELLSGSCESNCTINEYFNATHIHNESYIDVYSVEEDIVSEATVQATGFTNAITIYNAGESVCLNPSFEAKYGSTFLAFIDGCEPIQSRTSYTIKSEHSNSMEIMPNPFINQTTVAYQIFKDDVIIISVSDIMGKKIAPLINNEHKTSGKYQLTFNGTNLPAGIYYCTIQVGDYIETQKMVLTK